MNSPTATKPTAREAAAEQFYYERAKRIVDLHAIARGKDPEDRDQLERWLTSSAGEAKLAEARKVMRETRWIGAID